jgi:hypothetical protein
MMAEFVRKPWEALRSDVEANDTAINTYEYSNAVYLASKWSISTSISSIIIALWGKDAENYTCAYKLFGRASKNSNGIPGPIESVAAGNLALGSQLITTDPISGEVETGYWVDTITNTVEWTKPISLRNVGNNGICYLAVDVKQLQDVYLELTLDGGGGTQVTEMNAIISGTSNL